MFNFTITTAELIGWIIIYIVGLICVALGLGCVIHGERQKRFQLQQQLDYMMEAIGTLEQRVIDLESHATWIDEFDRSEQSVLPDETSNFTSSDTMRAPLRRMALLSSMENRLQMQRQELWLLQEIRHMSTMGLHGARMTLSDGIR